MKSKVYILTGEKQSGKSTLLEHWVKSNPNVQGFITLDQIDGIRYIINLASNIIIPYGSKKHDASAIAIGNWYLNKAGFQVGIDIITNYDIKRGGVLIIDEIGNLEMKGEGYSEALLGLMKKLNSIESEMTMLLVVRSSLVDEVIDYYDIQNATVISKEELNLVSF